MTSCGHGSARGLSSSLRGFESIRGQVSGQSGPGVWVSSQRGGAGQAGCWGGQSWRPRVGTGGPSGNRPRLIAGGEEPGAEGLAFGDK